MKNVFTWETNKKILAFIDIDGHLSGSLMKNIDFRQPRIISELKEHIAKNGNSIGNIINISNYTFVTVRKHYASKVDLKKFEEMIALLDSNQTYKTTGENYTECLPFLAKYSNIEIYESSSWETR